MSSVFRVFKFRSYLNTAARTFSKNTRYAERFLNLHRFELPLQLGPCKIWERAYSFQHPQHNDDFLHSSQARNLEMEFQHVDSLLERGSYIKLKVLDNLINKVANAEEIIPSQGTFLLNCCGSLNFLESKATRIKLVSRVWKIFNEKGLSLDISHYNAFLQVLVENEAEFSPLDFLATLEEKNIKPNRMTYSRLIAKFCQKGDIDGANKILEHMKNNELEINEYVFSSLILGNSRANDLEGAVAVLDIMKQSDVNIGSDTYAALIQAYGEHKKFDEIDNIISDIKKVKESLSENMLLEIVCTLVDRSPSSVIEKILDAFENKDDLPMTLLKQAASQLVYFGHYELAYKIYKNLRRSEDQHYIGNFFPKLMASASKDLSKVVYYCDDMRKNGLNILSYELAFSSYLLEHDFGSAMSLARVMKEKGITLKEHYFYPILINAGQMHIGKVFEIFDEIVGLEVHLSVSFFSDFLLPSLKITDDVDQIDSLFMRFLSYRDEIIFQNLYNGFVEYLLMKFGLQVAANFVKQNPRSVYQSLVPMLSSVYLETLDAEATAQILHQILPMDIRMHRDFVEEEIENRYGGFRNFFRRTINGLRRKDLFDTHMPSLLKAMEKEGTYLIPSIIEGLTSEFGESLNPSVQETLKNLSDISLVPPPNNAQDVMAMKTSLRSRIVESEASGQFDEFLNTQLLLSSIRKEKSAEIEEIVQKFKSNNIHIPPPVKVMLLGFYAEQNQVEKAEEELNDFLETYPDVQISSPKIMKIVKMFTDMGRFEDAIKCVLINSPENGKWPDNLQPNFEMVYYRAALRDVLNSFVDNCDLPTLKRMQEALLSKNFARPEYVISSLISYHLRREDNMEEALACFKKAAEEHKITVGKNELSIACIKKEDTDKLQQILDVSNRIHGEFNTLYDLVFCFIETGKFVQAERVLQTSGMRAHQGKLYDRCSYYARKGFIEELKGLISVTKNLFNVSRQKLYGYLLEAYILADDPDNSLGVWTMMQEESVNPDEEFMARLGNYLKAKGCEVPFVIPQINIEKEKHSPLNEPQKPPRRGNSANMKFSEEENEINSYIKNEMISKATDLTMKMLQKGRKPSRNILKPLLHKLDNIGDVAPIELLGKYMDNDAKGTCFYNYHLSSSYVNAGRTNELFERNRKYLQENSHIDIHEIHLTQGVLHKILVAHPEMYSEAVNLIELLKKSEQKNVQHLSEKFIGVLFDHHFLSGNAEEAEKIYNENLQDKNNFKVEGITSTSFKENNTERLDSLLEIVNRKPEGRENLKGFIYSTYIDILANNEKFEEAVNVIKKSLESLSLKNYRQRSLSDLEMKMKSKDLNFPFEIPSSEKTGPSSRSSSSSSSSSDEEK